MRIPRRRRGRPCNPASRGRRRFDRQHAADSRRSRLLPFAKEQRRGATWPEAGGLMPGYLPQSSTPRQGAGAVARPYSGGGRAFRPYRGSVPVASASVVDRADLMRVLCRQIESAPACLSTGGVASGQGGTRPDAHGVYFRSVRCTSSPRPMPQQTRGGVV